MPLNYPFHVAHDDYSKPPAKAQPAAPTGGTELEVSVSGFTKLKRKVKGTTIRAPANTFSGVDTLCFWEPKNKRASQSFNDSLTGTDLDVVHTEAFCFAPGVDDPTVAFNVLNTGGVAKVTFELFCKKGGATAFWSKEWTSAKDLKQLLTHPIVIDRRVVRGSLALSKLVDDLDATTTIGGDPDPAFPDGVLTLNYAPYQLKMTVEGKPDVDPFPSVAWTYLHVMAHTIRLDWLRLKSKQDEKLARCLPPARRQREVDLYTDLLASKDDYNLRGAFPSPGEVKKIPLEGNVFFVEEDELQSNTGYECWKAHWGDGPNLPVVAHVSIRNMKGKGVLAPLALGNARLLWSYTDDAQPMSREGTGLGPANTVPADASPVLSFLRSSQDYLTAKPTDDASPTGKNCHVDRGGKRGAGAKPIFPPQAGTTDETLPSIGDMENDAQAFPFKVVACATRKWAALSTFRTKGELEGTTGVIFQPSRMPGDAYKLVVALACSDVLTDLDKAEEDALDDLPAGLGTTSGSLEVWRQLYFAKYMNASDVVIDYEIVRQKLERNFVWLKVLFKKPDKFNTAPYHTALETIRTDDTHAIPDYVRLALCAKADLGKTPHGEANSGGHSKYKDYLFPFIDFESWQAKLIALKGSWDSCLTWADTYTHPQPDYWHSRGAFGRPVMRDYPFQFECTSTGAGTEGEITVTLRPDHPAPHQALNGPATLTVVATSGALDDVAPGDRLIEYLKDDKFRLTKSGGDDYPKDDTWVTGQKAALLQESWADLPAPLVLGDYYLIVVDAKTIKFAQSRDDAMDGTAIAITGEKGQKAKIKVPPGAKAQIRQAFDNTHDHCTMSENWDPDSAGEMNDKYHRPRYSPLKVKVEGHTVSDEDERQVREICEAANEAMTLKAMKIAYSSAIKYQWEFDVLRSAHAEVVGEGGRGVTVLALPVGVLSNHTSPAGKAMAATPARNAACIPMMNSNDDTLLHEFCHSMFLNHGDQASNDVFQLHQTALKAANIMTTGNRQAQLDGFLMLRLRGWSFIKVDANGDVLGTPYPDATNKPGIPVWPAEDADTTDPGWWTGTAGGSTRTLFPDGGSNSA